MKRSGEEKARGGWGESQDGEKERAADNPISPTQSRRKKCFASKTLLATQSISFGGTARACKTSVIFGFIHTRFFSKIIVYSKTLFFTWPVLKIKRRGGYQQVLPIAKSQVTVFNQKSNFEEKLKIEIVIVDNLSPLRLTTSWSWDQFWTKSVATVGLLQPRARPNMSLPKMNLQIETKSGRKIEKNRDRKSKEPSFMAGVPGGSLNV